jgi:hypothetical protein
MKKTYEKPRMEIVEFRFSDHIAASNSPSVPGGTSGTCTYGWNTYTNSFGWTSPDLATVLKYQ